MRSWNGRISGLENLGQIVILMNNGDILTVKG